DEAYKERSDFAGLQNVLRRSIFHGVLRHLLPDGILWVLGNGDSAALFNGIQSGRPVIEEPTENDSDYTRTMLASRASEQRIDGGAMAVFSWPAQHSNAAIFQHEVKVRRCHVDVPRSNCLVIDWSD